MANKVKVNQEREKMAYMRNKFGSVLAPSKRELIPLIAEFVGVTEKQAAKMSVTELDRAIKQKDRFRDCLNISLSFQDIADSLDLTANDYLEAE